MDEETTVSEEPIEEPDEQPMSAEPDVGPREAGISASLAAQFVAIVAVFVIGAVLLASAGPKYRTWKSQQTCLSHLKQIYSASFQYCDDYGGRLPLSGSWNSDITPYLDSPDSLRCPAETVDKPAYAMNRALSDLYKSQITSPAECVAFYESSPKANATGGPELFPHWPRHGERHMIISLSGSAFGIRHQEIGELGWNPSIPPRQYG